MLAVIFTSSQNKYNVVSSEVLQLEGGISVQMEEKSKRTFAALAGTVQLNLLASGARFSWLGMKGRRIGGGGRTGRESQ